MPVQGAVNVPFAVKSSEKTTALLASQEFESLPPPAAHLPFRQTRVLLPLEAIWPPEQEPPTEALAVDRTMPENVPVVAERELLNVPVVPLMVPP
jgi:hypothetical protein